jgi:acetyl-CoA C-acetyltransferase
MQTDPIVIVSYARTPIGNLLGELQTFAGYELGSAVIKAVIERAAITPDAIHEVIMGCVLPAGQGQAPARQAALNADVSTSTPCTTINKVCGSAMKSVMFAHDAIAMGSTDIAIAGGMESMTNAPYLLLKARQGYRFGKNEIFDHMTLDGLEDAYDKGLAMGVFADQCAQKYGITRKEQDDFAISSLERAQHAVRDKLFAAEITPLVVKSKQGEKIIADDEKPFSVKSDRIPTLNAAFTKDGTVTAGNASSIADGAAAVMLMRESEAKKRGLKPVARIIAHASHAQTPAEFTTAPIEATKKLLQKINWSIDQVDLFEINEAFAVVAVVFMKELNIPRDKVNIHGGACALGHPIGATGARILVTLLSALTQNKMKRGVATLCIGGGEATALAVEII